MRYGRPPVKLHRRRELFAVAGSSRHLNHPTGGAEQLAAGLHLARCAAAGSRPHSAATRMPPGTRTGWICRPQQLLHRPARALLDPAPLASTSRGPAAGSTPPRAGDGD
ncbi:unnamed protein product [Urochloa humidicola]